VKTSSPGLVALIIGGLLLCADLVAEDRVRVAPSILLGSMHDVRGVAAPDFELRDLADKKVKLADFRGKVILLNFWATWCLPCRQEVPLLVELQNKYGPDGLQIVGVDMDVDADDRLLNFVREQKINYPVLMADTPTEEAYGAMTLVPQTFFIDRSGKVASRVLGTVEGADIEAVIKNGLGDELKTAVKQ
jgi:thiol-disulfide isomerase/thioredoxin